jgi:hypothetical protein
MTISMILYTGTVLFICVLGIVIAHLGISSEKKKNSIKK